MSTRRQTYITVAVMAATIVVLVAALSVRTDGALEATTRFLSRWFFAIFSTLFAFTQARVYRIRRRQQARVASYVPSGLFGFFAALWFVLAVASLVYGVLGLGGWWEITAWAVLAVVICVQLLSLGRLERRTKPERP